MARLFERIRRFFGYRPEGVLWDGAPAYWHRGRAYRKLSNGRYLRGLTKEDCDSIDRMMVESYPDASFPDA